MQSFGCDKYVTDADYGHEDSRYSRDEPSVGITFIPIEPYGSCPQGEAGECLVGPGEVTPYYLEVYEDHAEDAQEERYSYHQALGYGSLVEVEEVGYYQSCGAQSRIAAGDRCGNDAYDG